MQQRGYGRHGQRPWLRWGWSGRQQVLVPEIWVWDLYCQPEWKAELGSGGVGLRLQGHPVEDWKVLDQRKPPAAGWPA